MSWATHVMGYLKLKHNTRLIFDPTYPKIDQTMFPAQNWMEFYGDVKEAIRAPKGVRAIP